MSPSLGTVEDRANALLDACRKLRLLDDAIRVAREDLNEVAGLVVKLSPAVDVPPHLRRRLRVTVRRINSLETKRRALLGSLDSPLVIVETVPVRVLS